MRNYISLFLLLATAMSYAQITVDTSLTTQQLVEDILINSSCAEVSNFSAVTGTDFGDDNGIAAFDANGSDFPFASGIVLTSGNVLNSPGPNLTLHSDGGFGWPGDADLEANTTATNTNNASFIQFDFVPSITQISFDFIMASEEYDQNFECDFSDAFAFILTDQATGTVQNLAVLPGTNIPIEVTNIHPEVPGQCPAINEQYFDKYNFAPFNPAGAASIDFNGQTVTLTAMGDVTPGNAYTIKLVIADETDTAFDSAVFLAAGSFDIGNVDLGDDILLTGGNAVCEGEIITLDAGSNPDATYEWFKDNVLIPGANEQTLDISETGLYRVEIAFSGGQSCVAIDEILVEFFANPEFSLGDDQLVCDMQFTTLDATVTNPSELQNVSYKWFQDGVEIPGETNPTLDVNVTATYTAEVTGNDCVVSEDIDVRIVSFTVDIGDFVEPCGDDSFEIIPIIIGEDPAGATYLWSTGETTPTIVVTEDGTYTVEVTINDCVETDSVEINFRTLPIVELGETIVKCAQDISVLDATPSNAGTFTYTWFLDGGIITGQSSSTLEVTEAGIYAVEVNDEGCIAVDEIEVTFYDNENCVITQGISPNGDGQNDFLDLEFLDDKSDIVKIAIYNRHGLLVYEKSEYVNEWGGQTDTGDILPVGTYYYVIELLTEAPITGWVYLNK